jgi:hypothetical protein
MVSSPLFADLVFTLDQPLQTGVPGAALSFSGTLLNTNLVDTYLNGTSYNAQSSDLTLDDSAFFTFTPLFLAPGASYSGSLFDINISPAALEGTYFGSFTVVGGPDAFTFDPLATQNFEVVVTPEPGSWLLLGTVLAGIGLRLRRLPRPGQTP